ncbi:hypothetical protein [uncultured Winogradskyella sp.]|uniref:hypothetical protein n=1 Tax=Winogradskyella sp. 4-2091 TaxID=3381659 RepID=UPI0026394021|nr:hypothetical protein [uncultured Winogradskyella sp.]
MDCIITKLGIGSAAAAGSIRGGALFLIIGSCIELFAAIIAFFKVYNYYRKE